MSCKHEQREVIRRKIFVARATLRTAINWVHPGTLHECQDSLMQAQSDIEDAIAAVVAAME